MPRRERTFTDDDILRFITNNLTVGERDYVICSILLGTGSLGNPVGPNKIIDLAKTFVKGGLAGAVLDLIGEILSEGKYNKDF